MNKYGLALSGGGFRACLYHLGVIRYLRDVGLLSQVSDITAVSGGSIIGAHLALNWDRYNGSNEDFQSISEELIEFLQLDVRNRIVRRFPLASLANMTRRALRIGSRRQYTRAGLLELHYEKYLYGDRGLFDLPDSPRLYILATDVNEGSVCAFYRDGILLQRRSAFGRYEFEHLTVGLATVPMAVAASSAFPGFFPPLQLHAEEVGASEGDFGRHTFTDGGIYDNVGLRMFHHLQHSNIPAPEEFGETAAAEKPSFEKIFVSNAGATFKVRTGTAAGGLLSTAMRSSDILMDRVNQLELESFENDPGLLFFPITDVINPADDPSVLHPAIQRQTALIRTDMDRFSDLEISTLIHHGYCVARSVCRKQVDATIDGAHLVWNPLTENNQNNASAERVENDPLQAGRELQRSSSRRIFSTLLSINDWPTYLWLPLVLFVVLTIPYQLYQSKRIATQRGYVITAVSATSPVYRKILSLIEEGPASFPEPVEYEDVPSLEPSDVHDFEVLSDSRIFDLRQWSNENTGQRSAPYSYSRIQIRRKEDSAGTNLRLQSLSSDEDLRFVCLTDSVNARYFRASQPNDKFLWEINLDLSHMAIGDDSELDFAGRVISEYANASETEGRFQFTLQADTGVVQIWILMPQDREYTNFEISGYPVGRSEERKTIIPTSKVELPVGSIATFQIINPSSEFRYECKWNWIAP